jgi:alpha-beta hydrolase superfamily lysophospholipase
MDRVIKTRELFTLNCQGTVIHGTRHFPGTDLAEPNRIGILFLPGFPMPRSAHGDSAVYLATSFADLGYSSFRIDLPGIGDSYGDVPAELLQFVIRGGYESVVASLTKQIVDRYKLTGMVILGHCAGAVSAIFAASSCEACLGLVLLDVPFHVQSPGSKKVKNAMFYWSTRTRLGAALSKVYDHCRNIYLHLRRNAPPKNANVGLLKRWKTVASADLPILLLNAPAPKATGATPRVGKFDYLQHILKLAGNRSRVEVRIIEGANHAFSNSVAREGVRREVEDWMPRFFPLENAEPAAAEVAQPVPVNNEAEFVNHEPMLVPVDATLGS